MGRIQYAPTLTNEKIYPSDQFWGYVKWNDPFFDLKKDYAKQYNLLFDLENVHAESIILLLKSRKSYAKCIGLLFESKKGHAKWQERILGKCFREVFLRYLFSGSIFLCHKTKALRICGKIRSAKQKESI